jgi:hypothetical protein
MINASEWQQNNEAHLEAAIKWLRLSLECLAITPPENLPQDAAGPVNGSVPAQERWSIFRRKETSSQSSSPVTLLTPGHPGDVLRAQLAEAATALAAAAEVDPPPALKILSERLGLSRFEQEIVLLCAAFELDTRIANLCALAHDDPQKPYPTFALALAMFEEPAWDALSPHRPLRFLRLLEINQPASQPLTASSLRADERILNFIKGLNEFDDRIVPMLIPVDRSDIDLPPSQQETADAILREAQHSVSGMRLPLIELTGVDTASKQFIASSVADALHLELYRLPVEVLPSNAAELETLARLWQRETLLKPVALYLDASELGTETHVVSTLQRFLAQGSGLIFLDTRASLNSAGNEVVFDVANPTHAEQKEAWVSQLRRAANDSASSDEPEDENNIFFAALLANQFNLSLPAIHHIGGGALDRRSEETSLHDAVWEMCLSNSRSRLDTLAQRIDPKATRDDIVLPAQESELLDLIVEQVRHRGTVYDEWGFRARMNRGLGISALFAGESGTGKTMAAEVIANQLRLNLYRIDLSSVVSKYIGETEKNLRQVFDAAENDGAILFFDEADALFGKRSEVKDSHDRYANIEINYLLQRLEGYRGLAILATNMKSSLDSAFMRRLRFIVNFPFPEAAERLKIWQKVFPADTPTAELNYERLARFNLSGGSINNVALNAAFRATRESPPRVTMQLIFDAVQGELRKQGRAVNPREFEIPKSFSAES